MYVNQPSLATELTEDQAQRVAAAGTQYWEQNRPASLRPRPRQVDPVRTAEGRAQREQYISRRGDLSLEEKYRLFRLCTRHLASLGQ